MLRKFYLLTGMATLALYGVVAFSGWELGTPQREKVPPGARDSKGYKSFHFWHAGYHGGK